MKLHIYLNGSTLATLIRAIHLRKLLQIDGLTKKKLYGILLSMKFRIMDTWMIKKANDLHKTAILSKWIWIIRLLLSSCTLSVRTHSVLVTIVHLFVSQHNNGTLTHTTTNYNCKQENSKQLSLIQGFARYYFKIPIILFIRFSAFRYAHVASISIRTDLLCFFWLRLLFSICYKSINTWMVRKIKLFSVCFEQWTAVHMYRFWYGKARLPFIHFVKNNFEWK